jgi:hypothetical protein
VGFGWCGWGEAIAEVAAPEAPQPLPFLCPKRKGGAPEGTVAEIFPAWVSSARTDDWVPEFAARLRPCGSWDDVTALTEEFWPRMSPAQRLRSKLLKAALGCKREGNEELGNGGLEEDFRRRQVAKFLDFCREHE